MDPQDVPDLTIEELRAMDDDDEFSLDDEDIEEMQTEFEDMQLIAEYTMMAVNLGRLLMADQITFREYIEYMEWVEDEARENDVTLP